MLEVWLAALENMGAEFSGNIAVECAVDLRVELIVVHDSKERVLLRRRDELGSPVTILPCRYDITGKTGFKSACLDRSMAYTPLLHRSPAVQPCFKEYDDHAYVLNVELSHLVSMNINLTYHSALRGLHAQCAALDALSERLRRLLRNQAAAAPNLNACVVEKVQIHGA